MTNVHWIERTILVALAFIVMALATLGYESIKTDLQTIKRNQEVQTKLIAKHEYWLRLPYEDRKKYFMKDEVQ